MVSIIGLPPLDRKIWRYVYVPEKVHILASLSLAAQSSPSFFAIRPFVPSPLQSTQLLSLPLDTRLLS